MDFWEITKLLFRRWYITAPMLLLSVGATLFAGVSVKPDYQATSHLQLLPPLTTTPDVAGKPRNPWNDLGINSIGNAVIIGLGDQSVLDNLQAQGYSPNFTVALDARTPVMTIEAVAPTPQKAIDTARAVGALINQNVLSLQRAYGAPDASLITTHSLDAGTNVTRVDSKLKRALAVIGGVGLLLTAAITIGVDAILRNRAKRRSKLVRPKSPVDLAWEAKESPDNAGTPVRHGTAWNGGSTGGSRGVQGDGWLTGPPAGNDTGADDLEMTELISEPADVPSAGLIGARPANGAASLEQAKDGHREDAAHGQLLSPESDATIVLPLGKERFWNVARGGRRR